MRPNGVAGSLASDADLPADIQMLLNRLPDEFRQAATVRCSLLLEENPDSEEGRTRAEALAEDIVSRWTKVGYLSRDPVALRLEASRCAIQFIIGLDAVDNIAIGNDAALKRYVFKPHSHGVKAKAALKVSISQLMDVEWWCRQLQRESDRQAEHIATTLGLVGGESPYCSDFSSQTRHDRKARVQKNTYFFDGSNRKKRAQFAERIAMTKGIEQYAQETGLSDWCLITLTAPPRFHPNPLCDISSYEGTGVKDALDHLNQRWGRIRSLLHKHHISIMGQKSVDAHKTGVPHFHMLLHCPPGRRDELEHYFRQHAEHQQETHFKWNDGRATATTYIFSSFQTGNPEVDGEDDRREKVEDWRSTYNVRSFELIGLPTGIVGLWRNVRALQNKPADPFMQELFLAAHQGQFARFLALKPDQLLNCVKKQRQDKYGRISHAVIGLQHGYRFYSLNRKDSLPPFDLTRIISHVIQHTSELKWGTGVWFDKVTEEDNYTRYVYGCWKKVFNTVFSSLRLKNSNSKGHFDRIQPRAPP